MKICRIVYLIINYICDSDLIDIENNTQNDDIFNFSLGFLVSIKDEDMTRNKEWIIKETIEKQ